MALVALPYYANASLADRVVPEQFYDADTEASLGAEQGTHQGTRDAGTSSSNTNFEAIEALLTTLTANITAEREACVTQNAEDTASCQATQVAASVRHHHARAPQCVPMPTFLFMSGRMPTNLRRRLQPSCRDQGFNRRNRCRGNIVYSS